jgi:ankyrin repeat protein
MSDTDIHNISPEEKHAPAISQAVARYERLKEKHIVPDRTQILRDAAERGDLDFLKEQYNPLEDDKNLICDSIIMDAAGAGHLDIVKYFIEETEGIHSGDLMGTAVRKAASAGQMDVLRYFYEEYSGNMTSISNWSLKKAAENGQLEAVKYLCEKGENAISPSTSPVIDAIQFGHLDILKYFYENTEGIQGRTAAAIFLNLAADYGRLEIVRYLYETGTCKLGSEALGKAAANGHLDIVKYLHEHGEKFEGLSVAVRHGHLDIVKYMHEHGADITTAGDYLYLHSAATHGHLDIIKYITQNAPDKEMLVKRLSKPLAMASRNGHMDAVKYLHEQGVDITAHNNNALYVAIGRGHLDIVKYLCENGADISASHYRAARHLGARFINVLDYLVEEGFVPRERLSHDQEKVLNSYRSWQKRHGYCPDGLLHKNPHYFRPKAFYPVRAVLEKEQYNGSFANQYAYNAAALFKTPDRFWRYVEKWADFSDKQPVHDVIQHIDIPQKGRFDLTAWGDACLKFGPKMTRLVKFADQLPAPMKDEKGGWSYTLTRDEIAKNAYKKAHEAPELAKLCFEVDYTNANFEKALETLNAHTNIVAKTLETKAPAPNSQIPDIRIDGDAFDKPGYVLRKLESGDVKGLLLGEFTDCCQHIAGQGSECAEHGFLSSHGGFYVVEKQETGEITGQSWVWRGKDGELVLDSFESLKGHYNAQQVTNICEEIARAASYVQKLETPVNGVYIGTGGATPKTLAFNRAASPAQPKDYSSYRDSHQQYEIATFERGIG